MGMVLRIIVRLIGALSLISVAPHWFWIDSIATERGLMVAY
jgi:hypothetical protein